jgi:hypothetical protein
MPEDTDLSDIGDVLASRLAAIGVDPEGDAPLNLPSSVSTDEPAPAGDDLVAQTLKLGEQEDTTPDSSPPAAVAPSAAEPVTPAAQEPTASAPPAVMAYLRDKYGADFSAKYTSDEAFLQGVINLNKKIGERDEDAQVGRVLKEDPARVAQWLQQTYPQLFPKPEPQPEPAKPTNGKPQGFSPAWLKAMQIKPGVDPAIQAEIEQWAQNEALAHTPIGQQLQQTRAELDQLKQILAQGLPQQPGVDVDSRLAAFQQGQAAKEFVNANQWLFSETNGVRVLSPDGFVYKQALEEAHRGGASFEMAKKYADNALAVHRSRAAPVAPKPSPTTNPAAARQPAAAVPSTDDKQEWVRDGEDLEAALFRNLKREGLLESLGAF